MKTIQAQRGFSLIELMIAITLAMVAMLAATELYSSTRQTYKLQNMQARLAEDGRFALSMLQRVISQAGYRPDPKNAMGNYLEVAANQSVTVRFFTDGSNMILCDGSVPTTPNLVQSLVIAKSGYKLQCGTVDWIAPASTGTGNGSELIDFRIRYGIDTGPAGTLKEFGCGTDTGATKGRDCVADSYVDTVTDAALLKQIVAVKVCLILRTESSDAAVSKAAAVSNCSGTAIDGSQTDNKLYRTFRSTITLRNQ